jgi:FlaA1/EpsC-like NDP-sugar epimerase
MEQWGSDFSFDTNLTEAAAIENIAAAFTKPSEGGSYEARVIGIRNGEQVIHTFDQSSNWQKTTYSHNTHSNHTDWEQDENEGNRLHDLIQKRVGEILEFRQLTEEKEKAQKKKEEAKKQELYERQQLAALQKKYTKE